ncbi:MAG: hypothetical protein ACFCVC_13045, partial [Acidimicrobiia bacterium]
MSRRASARLDALEGGSPHTDSALAAVATTEDVLTALAEAGSSRAIDLANELALTTAIPALMDVEEAASVTGAAAAARIEAERAEADDTAFASSLLVALFIPGLALTTLWFSSRRRVERLSLQAE